MIHDNLLPRPSLLRSLCWPSLSHSIGCLPHSSSRGGPRCSLSASTSRKGPLAESLPVMKSTHTPPSSFDTNTPPPGSTAAHPTEHPHAVLSNTLANHLDIFISVIKREILGLGEGMRKLRELPMSAAKPRSVSLRTVIGLITLIDNNQYSVMWK